MYLENNVLFWSQALCEGLGDVFEAHERYRRTQTDPEKNKNYEDKSRSLRRESSLNVIFGIEIKRVEAQSGAHTLNSILNIKS